MEEENANNGAGGAGVTPLAGQGDQPGSPGLERRPAADGPLRPRDVTSYDGSYIEAVTAGLYEIPPPMMWNYGKPTEGSGSRCQHWQRTEKGITIAQARSLSFMDD